MRHGPKYPVTPETRDRIEWAYGSRMPLIAPREYWNSDTTMRLISRLDTEESVLIAQAGNPIHAKDRAVFVRKLIDIDRYVVAVEGCDVVGYTKAVHDEIVARRKLAEQYAFGTAWCDRRRAAEILGVAWDWANDVLHRAGVEHRTLPPHGTTMYKESQVLALARDRQVAALRRAHEFKVERLTRLGLDPYTGEPR